MKRDWTLACLVFLIAFGFIACSSIGNQAAMVVEGQAFSGIDIIAPSNSTYTSNLIPLIVNGTEFVAAANIYVFMNYSLDGQSNQTLPFATEYPWDIIMMVVHIGSVNLLNLPEGPHSITVYAAYVYPNNYGGNTTNFYSKTVYFNVVLSNQTTPVPTEGQPFFSGIDILSPSNTTHDSRLIPLVVKATRLGGSNSHVFMNYSLDGQSNQSIPLATEQPMESLMVVHTGAANLLNLPKGSHSITVYAEYVYPYQFANVTNFYSKTVYFNVVASTQTTPSQTATPPATPSATPTPYANQSQAATTSEQTPSSSPMQNPYPEVSPSPSPSIPEFPCTSIITALVATTALSILVIGKQKLSKKNGNR